LKSCRPALCWLGPPIGIALPHLSLSLPHPPLITGPVAAQPHLSVTQHRVARAPPFSPVRVARAPPSLSCFHSSAWHARADPHFTLSFSPTHPPIWRSRRCLTPLCSPSELEFLSFSTTYTSASLAPATRDPSSSLISVRAPPLPPLHGETSHLPLLSPFEAALTSLLPR
jgi:hypothetical protein